MSALADLQREFAQALRDPGRRQPSQVCGPRLASAERRFNVHRNNMVAGLIEALQATYPAVHRLVGEEYFSAVARAFIGLHPPRSPMLLHYGGEFGDFLEGFPSAAGVPYLGDVARLEWARTKAFHAADAEPIGLSTLADIADSRLKYLTLELHPSLTLLDSRWPVDSLWRACCTPDQDADVNMDEPQQVAIVRPVWQVAIHVLPSPAAAFAQLLQQGWALGEATQHCAGLHQDFDLADSLRRLFGIGAVVAVKIPQQDEEQS
ncbi:MAG: DNA-binding domain-containing protein [Thiogranum sp.]|nr:DNA-binding domain-containing protein [Thiogranum sp.]